MVSAGGESGRDPSEDSSGAHPQGAAASGEGQWGSPPRVSQPLVNECVWASLGSFGSCFPVLPCLPEPG